jgi:Domain of unknown function (DUF4062)
MNSDIPKVFISSVCKEFEYERQFLANMLADCGYNPIYSESPDFTLFSRLPPAKNCLANVQKSHILILILGEEYGTKNENGVSIVEEEYQTAKENNLHIIVSLTKSSWEEFWLWKAGELKTISTSQEEQYKFIEKVRPKHYIFPFEDVMGLCNVAKDKIANIFSELLEANINQAKELSDSNREGTIHIDLDTGKSMLSYFLECLEKEYARLNPTDMCQKYKRSKHWHRKCSNLLDIEPTISPVWSIGENISTELHVAIGLVNEGIATGIPDKMKCAAALLATCCEEFYMLFFSLTKVKTSRNFQAVFHALGDMILIPIGEVYDLLAGLRKEYEKALEKLHKNPGQKQYVCYNLVLTLGDDEKFSKELERLVDKHVK